MVFRPSRGSRSQFQDDPNAQRPQNVFRNDGSFLEMFKRMQEQGAGGGGEAAATPVASSAPVEAAPSPPVDQPAASKPTAPLVGKRRGGRVLPTGKVKRTKLESETAEQPPTDAWSAYLAEVKRYKETTCEEDGKTRPLVK